MAQEYRPVTDEQMRELKKSLFKNLAVLFVVKIAVYYAIGRIADKMR